MEEIKVGEYVRTYTGKILKVRTKIAQYICTENWLGKNQFTIEEIKKHSPSIIDLIEEGDIVKVEDSLYDAEYISEVFKSYEDDLCINNFEVSEIIPIRKFIDENQINIKSIVTKEMFNQVKYEV